MDRHQFLLEQILKLHRHIKKELRKATRRTRPMASLKDVTDSLVVLNTSIDLKFGAITAEVEVLQANAGTSPAELDQVVSQLQATDAKVKAFTLPVAPTPIA